MASVGPSPIRASGTPAGNTAAPAAATPTTISRVGRSATVTAPTPGHADRLRAGAEVLQQQHERERPPTPSRRGAERQQHAAKQEVAEAVGNRVDHRAERAGLPGPQRDRAVEPVQHARGRSRAARQRGPSGSRDGGPGAGQRQHPERRQHVGRDTERPDRTARIRTTAASRARPATAARRRAAPTTRIVGIVAGRSVRRHHASLPGPGERRRAAR